MLDALRADWRWQKLRGGRRAPGLGSSGRAVSVLARSVRQASVPGEPAGGHEGRNRAGTGRPGRSGGGVPEGRRLACRLSGQYRLAPPRLLDADYRDDESYSGAVAAARLRPDCRSPQQRVGKQLQHQSREPSAVNHLSAADGTTDQGRDKEARFRENVRQDTPRERVVADPYSFDATAYLTPAPSTGYSHTRRTTAPTLQPSAAVLCTSPHHSPSCRRKSRTLLLLRRDRGLERPRLRAGLSHLQRDGPLGSPGPWPPPTGPCRSCTPQAHGTGAGRSPVPQVPPCRSAGHRPVPSARRAVQGPAPGIRQRSGPARAFSASLPGRSSQIPAYPSA